MADHLAPDSRDTWPCPFLDKGNLKHRGIPSKPPWALVVPLGDAASGMAGTSRVLTGGVGCAEIARDVTAAWRVEEEKVFAEVVRECVMHTEAYQQLAPY